MKELQTTSKISDASSPDDALAADETFDLRDFDPTGIEFPATLVSPERLLARFGCKGTGRSEESDASQPLLFPNMPERRERRKRGLVAWADQRLWDIVVQAYADVRSERSSDYVVVDPDADARFLNRCFELGAMARPFDLNWMLINARKASKLSALPPAKAFSIPKAKLDLFAFTSDIAMRMVQERVCFEEKRCVSIDQVLCDPALVAEFDRLALGFAPDVTALECRWAVITLRKARRPARDDLSLPNFEQIGLLEDMRVKKLPSEGGAYWIQTDDTSVLTGVATNLQRQIGSLIERLGFNVVPIGIGAPPKGKARLAVSINGNYEACEFARGSLLKQSGSRLNFWYGDFLGAAA